MNREEINNLMADYLGDEMSAAQKSLFEKALAEHTDLAEEVSELAKTLSTLRLAEIPAVIETEKTTKTHGLKKERATTRFQLAAAVLIAFVAGFLFHGYLTGDRSEPTTRTVNVMQKETNPIAYTKWERDFASAYNNQTTESKLAKSWIAFSRAMRK